MKSIPHSLAGRGLILKGFSLIETLMAIAIVATASLGTLGLLVGSMGASQEANLRSRASLIAQDVFHDLQSGAWQITPEATAEFARQVLFYDPSGILLSGKSFPESTRQKTYDQGSPVSDAAWIVSIEGFRRSNFIHAFTGGQVLETSDLSGIAALGSASYPFASVSLPSDPTLAAPVTGTQVHISIETPPSSPKNRRKKFSYDFYWNR